MKHLELEARLAQKIRKSRIVLAVITAAAVMLSLTCLILREATAEVVTPDTGYDTLNQMFQRIEYNNHYFWGVLIGAMASVSAGIFLIGSFIHDRYDTVEVDGQYLTLYRGFGAPVLYVDGEEAARCCGYYLEATLRSGTKVTVSFSRSTYFAHMTFSNGKLAVEL